MLIQLQTIGIIAGDMEKTLAFYQTLGLPLDGYEAGEQNFDITLPNGITLGFLSLAMAQQADPKFVVPTGQSMNLQFLVASPADVDAVYNKLVAAGYSGYTEPWDAFWGQRFGRVTDPDGRVVNIYAHL